MKEERYRYNNKCENCKKYFKSDKASTRFCSENCMREYMDKRYPDEK